MFAKHVEEAFDQLLFNQEPMEEYWWSVGDSGHRCNQVLFSFYPFCLGQDPSRFLNVNLIDTKYIFCVEVCYNLVMFEDHWALTTAILFCIWMMTLCPVSIRAAKALSSFSCTMTNKVAFYSCLVPNRDNNFKGIGHP